VIHPQADVGVDLGRFVSLDASYAADAGIGRDLSDLPGRRRQLGDVVLRHPPRGHARLRLSRQALVGRVSATLGTERDYLSRQVGGTASVDLPGRNTTVALAYSHSFDLVCDKDTARRRRRKPRR